jgi:hypothetical protein
MREHRSTVRTRVVFSAKGELRTRTQQHAAGSLSEGISAVGPIFNLSPIVTVQNRRYRLCTQDRLSKFRILFFSFII